MKTAVYPGTFDPITCGHGDIVRRADILFDRVIVAVAVNAGKQPVWDIEERVELARKVLADLPSVEVVPFDNLLIEFAKQHGAGIILRGLRAVSDFEYEFQLALANRRMSGVEWQWVAVASTERGGMPAAAEHAAWASAMNSASIVSES